MEEQMRQLYGQLEQLTIQMGQLSAQMQRIEELEGGGKKASEAKPKPGAGQDQIAAYPQLDSGLEVIEDPVDAGGYQPGEEGGIQTAPGPKPLGTLPGGVIDGTKLEEIQPGADASLMPEEVETASLGGADIPANIVPEELYEQSYENLLRKRFGDAEAGFRTFVSRHREHELAGNAQYWLGETYYAQSNYKSAAQAFLAGYEGYPAGRKAPDSLVKLGMSLKQLGQKEQACTAYATVEVKFPKAAEARKRAQNESAKAGC